MENLEPTSSELLHSFMEGELDSSLEPSLFAHLNSSSELRTEMRDLLAMQRAVKRDRAAIVPPLASTAAVFGALGMSTSLLVNSSWASALWSKVWAPVTAAVLGGAVTWFAVSPNTAKNAQQNMQQSTTQATLNQTGDNVSVAVIHDTVIVTKTQRIVVTKDSGSRVQDDKLISAPALGVASSSDSAPSASAPLLSISNQLAAVPVNENGARVVKQQEKTEIEQFQAQPATILVRRVNPEAMVSATEVVNGTRELPELEALARPFERSFSASLRAINASSYVDMSGTPSVEDGFNNVALGVFYGFSDWFGAGVEIGRESFAMSFKGVSDGTVMRYESTQNLLWGSVQAQLYPFPSLRSRGWQPFFQFNGGFTNYGFMTKGLFGTSYAPTAHVKMMFGFEATGLFYSVQGTPFTTPKLGITYGIGYQL